MRLFVICVLALGLLTLLTLIYLAAFTDLGIVAGILAFIWAIALGFIAKATYPVLTRGPS